MDSEQQDLSKLLIKALALSQNGFAVFDPLDRFRYYNSAFASIFGFEGTSMLGRTLRDMMEHMYHSGKGTNIGDRSLEEWLELIDTKFRSEPFRSFSTDLVDGRWILVSEEVTQDGHVISTCRDITEQKEIETALRRTQVELERIALLDDLTGLPNRRHFLSRLDQEIARAYRHGHPLSVAMLDLDHFKSVNDRFGHAAGDEVLRHLAGFLHDQLRGSDIAGRLGGEEFAVLLPETTQAEAVEVIQRVIRELSKERLHNVAADFTYTFSCGLLGIDLSMLTDSTTLLSCADKALYMAKQSGRNQVVAFTKPCE